MPGNETSDAVKFEGVTPILRVEDVSRSVDYYVHKLGFKISFETPGFVSVTSRSLLPLPKRRGPRPSRLMGFWVGVEDVAALFEQYRLNGGKSAKSSHKLRMDRRNAGGRSGRKHPAARLGAKKRSDRGSGSTCTGTAGRSRRRASGLEFLILRPTIRNADVYCGSPSTW